MRKFKKNQVIINFYSEQRRVQDERCPTVFFAKEVEESSKGQGRPAAQPGLIYRDFHR